jgi:hypothetical protein
MYVLVGTFFLHRDVGYKVICRALVIFTCSDNCWLRSESLCSLLFLLLLLLLFLFLFFVVVMVAVVAMVIVFLLTVVVVVALYWMLRAPGLQGHENAGCSARGAPKGSKLQAAPATGPGLVWGLVILNESRGKSRVIPVNWQRNGARDSWDSLISLKNK